MIKKKIRATERRTSTGLSYGKCNQAINQAKNKTNIFFIDPRLLQLDKVLFSLFPAVLCSLLYDRTSKCILLGGRYILAVRVGEFGVQMMP